MIEKIKKIFYFFVPIGFKKYIRIWAVVFSVGMIISIIMAFVPSISFEYSTPKDVYVLKGNLVPAFESVVGERHGDLWRDEENEIAYAFNRTETSTADVRKYVQSLQTDGGYTLFKESSPEECPQFAVLLKEAVNPQCSICITITYPHDKEEKQDIFINLEFWNKEYNQALNELTQNHRLIDRQQDFSK